MVLMDYILCRFISQTFIDLIREGFPLITEDFMELFIRDRMVNLFDREILQIKVPFTFGLFAAVSDDGIPCVGFV